MRRKTLQKQDFNKSSSRKMCIVSLTAFLQLEYNFKLRTFYYESDGIN